MPNWTKEQKLAIEKEGSNIIVSAGAGSGKTAVLTERVIRKIKNGININELLILTFTEAASKEMKERIRKALREENLKEQLDLIDSSYITTFDSYALSIVKKYYYLLNINSNISVADSNIIKIKKEEILDKIFNSLYEKKDSDFYKLLNNFTNKNDKNIRNNIINIYDKIITIPNYNELLNNYFNIYFNEEYINNQINNFNNHLLSKISLIKDLIKTLSVYSSSDYVEMLKKHLKGLLESKNYDEIKLNSSVGKFPSLKDAEEEAKIYNEEIKKVVKDINKICIYKNEKEIYDSIVSTKDYIKVIIDIILKLDKELKIYKNKNSIYEFLDIELLAIKILKENKEVCDEIKYSLNEIMIDEYQDTNDIQEEFVSYIANNNVYMVGDIKQSIYRFRNANPYIFKEKYDNYSKHINGFKIDLNKNFRSREEVLDGINKIFSKIMDDEVGGANYIDSHQMIFGNNAYNEEGKSNQNNNLEIYNYLYDKNSGFKKEEYEIFIIANDIKNKVTNGYMVYDKDNSVFRKANYSDFVILIDKSKNFELYKKIFEYFNIPLSIQKDENLKDSLLLHLLNNLITLVIKINDNEIDDMYKHSLVSVLRSFIFEYSDEEILDIYSKNISNNILINKLKCININSMTSKDLINYFIDEFNIFEKLIKIGDIDSNLVVIDYIIDKTEELSNIGYTIKDFNNYLINTFENDLDIKFNVNKESNNSVRIMTIHKSKGLEFSICYFPELYNMFNKRELNELFLFDKKYGIITPYYDNGICDLINKYLLKEDYNKEEISERLRLFYVSLTRAKEKMILLSDLSDEILSVENNGIISNEIRLKYKSFNDIILSLKKELKIYSKEIKPNLSKDYEQNKDLNINIDKNNYDLIVTELEKDETLIEEKSFSKDLVKLNTKEEIENMKFGTYMHYLLETINLKEKNIDYIPNMYKEKINKFLNSRILNNIEKANIYKEYEFMYENDNNLYHGIIDLMIEHEDYIDIVDYKLKNIQDENYIKQLKGYKKYIENKFNKKVNIYLYSIIEEKLLDLI